MTEDFSPKAHVIIGRSNSKVKHYLHFIHSIDGLTRNGYYLMLLRLLVSIPSSSLRGRHHLKDYLRCCAKSHLTSQLSGITELHFRPLLEKKASRDIITLLCQPCWGSFLL